MGKKQPVRYSYDFPILKRKFNGRIYFLQEYFVRKVDAESYAQGFREQGRSARIVRFRGYYEVYTTMKRGEFRKSKKRKSKR